MGKASWLAIVVAASLPALHSARPAVRNIATNFEFNKLLEHHKTTGLPVIVDYYSDGCGPCRQIAPMYKKMAKAMKGRAVFTKIDVNQNRETSGAQGIRSMPTFQFYLNGKKRHQFSGGDPNQVQQWAEKLASESDKYNVQVSKESMVAFYKENAPDKLDEKKIDELLVKAGEGGGPGHFKLVKKLTKKYGKGPATEPAENRMPKEEKAKKQDKKDEATLGPRVAQATLEQLQEELQKRVDEAEEAGEGLEDEEAAGEDTFKAYAPGDFPERVTIIGGGPAGLAAAIYASRAGLRPVIIAPPLGGQLQGKGVTVENYPAVNGATGPAIVADMQKQAAEFGTVFEYEMVEGIDYTTKPFTIKTNKSEIRSHTVILATGADSRWLGIEGEEQFRGGGVSSCATCDGFLFRDQDVVVIGGGDTAMEDALVLARTSRKVTVIHRRDSFRASHILAQRVLENEKIEVRWNSTTVKFTGEDVTVPALEEGDEPTVVETLTTVHTKDVNTGEMSEFNVAAAFVAIGHIPNTNYVKDVVKMDANGYVELKGDGSTYTSIDGIFAAGDVADKVYRQAVTSAGSGAMAALDAERWLSEHGIGDEAAEFEAEMMRELLAEIDEQPDDEESAYPETYREPKKEEPEQTKEEEPKKPVESADEAYVQGEEDGVEVVEDEESRRDEL